MSQPKIEDLINNQGSGSLAVLFKSNKNESDGSVKSGYYANDGDVQSTDDYQIPASDDSYRMYACTSGGSFRIYYDSKSNGQCHVHYGNDKITVDNDAKLELTVEADGSLSLGE